MFDCVLPTRTARTGSALTWEGRLNLRNARFARDPRPLDEGCACPACSRFSRAYVRHLVNQQEILGLRLLVLHNLRFLLDLTAGARAAIERGALARVRARCARPPRRRRRPMEILIPLASCSASSGSSSCCRSGGAPATTARMQDALGLGDEIITAGGLHGEVREIDETVLRVEIAPGTVVARRPAARSPRSSEVEPRRLDDAGATRYPVADQRSS